MISIRALRIVARLEATSFLVLIWFSVINRDEDMIGILGPIHGALFVAFVAEVWLLREKARFTVAQTTLLMLSAVLPLGGYVADWWLARRWTASVD